MKKNHQREAKPGTHHPHRPARGALLFICLVIFSITMTFLPFGISKTSARSGQNPPQSQDRTPPQSAKDREEDDDPDLPGFMKGRIDKAEYLRLRNQHLDMLRGLPLPLDGNENPRTQAIREMERQYLQNAPFINDTTWTPIGPAPIPNGQTTTVSTAVSGRVTCIAVHPTNANKVYVGTAQGGVYRSLDGGTTWTAIFDTAQTLAIGAIAIDPVTPTTVFVGTGEGNLGSGCYFGVGLYRIINAETSPTLEGPFQTRTNGGGGNAFLNTAITSIVIDPTNTNNMLIGNNQGIAGISNSPNQIAFIGLYLCTNAQAVTPTFVRVTGLPGGGAAAVTDIAMEPGAPNTVVVGVQDFFTGSLNTGIWRSTNAISGGAASTWTRTLDYTGTLNSIKLTNNKIGAVVNVTAATSESSNGRLRKSTDGGQTWGAAISALGAPGTGFCGGQCSYDIAIAIDPANANIIYLGGSANGNNGSVLVKATNGTTFSRIDTGLHADSHALAIAPSLTTTVYTGNDGGVWKSTDSGGSWTSLNNTGFSATQFQSIAVHPVNQNFSIGGTQDNGTNWYQPAATWTRADFGDGGFALIDQNATNTTNVTMYHTYFNGVGAGNFVGLARVTNTACATEGQWVFRGAGIVDAGVGCEGVAFGANNGLSLSDTAVLFYAPMALGPGNPNTLYFGTDRLYRSINRGDTMTVVSQAPIVASTPISAIGIAPQNDNVRIVGLRNGQIFATTTGSGALTDKLFPAPTNPGSTTNKFISRVVVSPSDPNVAYVALSYYAAAGQGIWKTSNLSTAPTATWTASGSGIPSIPVNALVVDPSNANHLYAGTDIGVYNSTDAGATWNPYGTGLPRVAVFDMAIQDANHVLRIATHGRGMWEIFTRTNATAVRLDAFTASQFDDGRTLLEWQTASEVANLGFHVYRQQDGQNIRLTPQLIAGSALKATADLLTGTAYQWADSPPANQSVKYLLESIDLKGRSEWFTAEMKTMRGASRSVLDRNSALLTQLNRHTAQLSNTGSQAVERKALSFARWQPAAEQKQINLATQAAAKIAVKEEGFYQITQAELAAAGFSTKIDPRRLQLYVDGNEVPITVSGEADGSFDPADIVGFYGLGIDTPSTETRTYWLVQGDNSGKRISQAKGEGVSASPQSFAYTVERRDKTLYFTALKNGDTENFFGALVTQSPVEQTLTLQHLASTTTNANLEIALQGVTQAPHTVAVMLNGATIGTINFAEQKRGTSQFAIPQSRLREGVNVVTLVAHGGSGDVSLVEAIRCTYQHRFMAESNALKFTATAGQQISISGFTRPDIRVLDVTNPDAPQELAAKIAPGVNSVSVTVSVTGTGERRLAAFTQAKQPLALSLNQPSSWRNGSRAADLLILTAGEFAAAVEPLKALRQREGLAVEVVQLEDVFDEFSYGQKSLQAVKDFLLYARTSWQRAPRYLLLVGDATYDPKNYLGFGNYDFVPTKLLDTDYLETASDEWFADSNDDGVGEIVVGRLPVRSLQETTKVITKLVNYDSAAVSNTAILVSDANDGYNFERASARLRELLPPNFTVAEVKRGSEDGDTARRRLLEAINKGAKLINYTGHGSMERWRGDLFTAADAGNLTNARNLSAFVMMTCLSGYFQNPTGDSLAEGLMKAERGGAIAVWASSGLTEPALQEMMNQELYRALFEAGDKPLDRLGDAILRARSAVQNRDIRRTWILFGDPAMRLK